MSLVALGQELSSKLLVVRAAPGEAGVHVRDGRATSGRQSPKFLSRTGDSHLPFSDVVLPALTGQELGNKAQEI